MEVGGATRPGSEGDPEKSLLHERSRPPTEDRGSDHCCIRFANQRVARRSHRERCRDRACMVHIMIREASLLHSDKAAQVYSTSKKQDKKQDKEQRQGDEIR